MSTATMDSARNRIRELEEKRQRLDLQLPEARQRHLERRRALVEGECSAADVTAAESEVGVLQSAIADLDAQLQPLRAEIAAEEERAAREARQQREREELLELARKAVAHAQAYADARGELVFTVQSAAKIMAREFAAAADLTSQLAYRIQQLDHTTLEDVNREVPLGLLSSPAVHRGVPAWQAIHAFATPSTARHYQSPQGFGANLLDQLITAAREGRPV
jgi:uncharacterized protein (DUF3084 family)